MKRIIYTLLMAFPLWGLGGCSDDDQPNCQGIDCLPPATQTGAGTFGCLVNGEPFVDNSGFFNCFYQLVDGEYYFGISEEDDIEGIGQVFIGSNQRQIELNNIINLNPDIAGNFYGGININDLGGTLRTPNFGGIIVFTEFTVTDPNTGKVYEITEGRFDAQFTQ